MGLLGLVCAALLAAAVYFGKTVETETWEDVLERWKSESTETKDEDKDEDKL
jgi:hypothetical protein